MLLNEGVPKIPGNDGDLSRKVEESSDCVSTTLRIFTNGRIS